MRFGMTAKADHNQGSRMHERLKFCGYCGSKLVGGGSARQGPVCSSCGQIAALTDGPSLLVLTLIFAEDRTLLMKRGFEPYKGKWAPPGGFVERGESLEAAAIREVAEEVGIALNSAELMPHATISLPMINQVYSVFIAHLDKVIEASAAPPESLEVGWFTHAELAQIELWDPVANLDTSLVFEAARARRFEYLQHAGDFLRLFNVRGEIKYLWRR